ncbi:MAG: 16S rRNA (adenine(1518)-N(6)/adenine(1519)-N(6))-dimethyltransferase RsmA [Candidatus Aenigmatarchaeota archaeon]
MTQLIRKILGEKGARPLKKFSQNFLNDAATLARECGYAAIGKNDTVLEIGAGLGALTEFLSKRAKKVIAVEFDRKFCEILGERFKNSNVEVVQGDVLELKLPKFNKVVSNIPYHISSQITFLLFAHEWDVAAICYQKEFAKRMVATPGARDYSRLSVMTGYFSECELMETVSKAKFFPAPKVDSAIVRITPRRMKPYKVADEKKFFEVATLLFQHKKQSVRNALLHSRKALGLSKEQIRAIKSDLMLRKVFTLKGEEISEISEVL